MGRGWFGMSYEHGLARKGIRTTMGNKRIDSSTGRVVEKTKPDDVIDFKNIQTTMRFPLGSEQYDRLVRMDGKPKEKYDMRMEQRGIKVWHDLKKNDNITITSMGIYFFIYFNKNIT